MINSISEEIILNRDSLILDNNIKKVLIKDDIDINKNEKKLINDSNSQSCNITNNKFDILNLEKIILYCDSDELSNTKYLSFKIILSENDSIKISDNRLDLYNYDIYWNVLNEILNTFEKCYKNNRIIIIGHLSENSLKGEISELLLNRNNFYNKIHEFIKKCKKM